MTEHTLRDALNDIAADLTGPDLVDRSWADANRRRRRTQLAVVGAVAASVALIATGAAVIGGTPDAAPGSSQPSTGTTSPTSPTATASAAESDPDTTYHGVPVWWAPTGAAEPDLPHLDNAGLPPEIDLSAGAPDAAGIDRARAVFGIWPDGPLDRLVVLAEDGSTRTLDHTRLESAVDEGGEVLPWLSAESLAPDGRHAFFRQNSSLEIYEFATGSWHTADTPDWLAEDARWLDADTIWVPDELAAGGSGTTYGVDGRSRGAVQVDWKAPWGGADETPYGPARVATGRVAQAYGLGGALRRPDGSTYVSAEAVVARTGQRVHVLALPPDYADAEGRWKLCCPAAGWIGEYVAFESRHGAARLLAWRPGTGDVRQVAAITGWTPGQESYVASWALDVP